MYQITCDGLPLLDLRDDELVLINPKVNLEVNKVGEASFTIYKSHPNYDSLKKLKSVFEVSDDFGVVFRGRATRDTVDFDQGMMVDLEGAMAYFNDSVVRPFNFPDDFQVDGDRVAFFLGWLIDNHNSQVQDFQKMKLGNVTVQDADFARSVSEYASTWEVLNAKLIDSSLGGYLCIRYEEDGNYIDYLSEFTETNSQEIVFGENLLDLKTETEASGTYSAIIPIGALGLTIESLEDGNITDDIVKSGDTLYSQKAVDEYGWIYAPTAETTWDEVVDDADLLTTGVEWFASGGKLLNAIEATAVDLHYADKDVESLRIYKNVNVQSAPHGVTESFPLSRLEIDPLNPQNTKITVGKTIKTLTERTALQQEEAKKKYSKLSKTDEQIRLEVQDEIKNLSASIDISLDEIKLTVNGQGDQMAQFDLALDQISLKVQDNSNGIAALDLYVGGLCLSVSNGDESSMIKLMSGETEIDSKEIKMTGVVTFAGLKDGTTVIDGSCIQTGTIDAERLNLTGAITFSDLDEETQEAINNAGSDVTLPDYITETYIDETEIRSPIIKGGSFYAVNEDAYMEITSSGFELWGSDDDTKPKAELQYIEDYFVQFILGAGSEADPESVKGTMALQKDEDCGCIIYISRTSGDQVGFIFNDDGTITVHGTLVDASGNAIGG